MDRDEDESNESPVKPVGEDNVKTAKEEESLLHEMCNLWVNDDKVKVDRGNKDLENKNWDLYILGKVFTDKHVHF